MNVVIIELFARLRLASSHKPIFHLKTPDDSPAECASGGGEREPRQSAYRFLVCMRLMLLWWMQNGNRNCTDLNCERQLTLHYLWKLPM